MDIYKIEIETAKRIHADTGNHVIVVQSDSPAIFNTFNGKFKDMFESHGYKIVYDTMTKTDKAGK